MKTRSFAHALIASLIVLGALQGCSDDGDDNPTPPDITPSGGTHTNGGTSNKAGNGGKTDNAGTKNEPEGGTAPGSGGTTTDPVGGGGQGGDGSIPQPECDLPELGEDGCFNCPKNGELEQWLNRCSEGDCVPFENTQERLPLLKDDGTLPPLPN
jgi:hypothetical protein